jgi:hypothetical protein
LVGLTGAALRWIKIISAQDEKTGLRGAFRRAAGIGEGFLAAADLLLGNRVGVNFPTGTGSGSLLSG